MKILVSVLVFVIALATGVQTLASANAEEMNALFPPKQPNPSLSEIPEKPELASPGYFQKVTETKVTLEWKASSNAEVYHVQVAKDPNFKWLVTEVFHHKGTALDVDGLEAGKHYFWRVSGVRPNNKLGHTQGGFATSMFETVGR